MTLFRRTRKFQILRDVRQSFTSDSGRAASQWLYLYLPVVTPWCSNTQKMKCENFYSLCLFVLVLVSKSLSLVTILSSSLLQPVICISLSPHSGWQVASLLLYTSFLTNSPALSGEVASHITSSPLHHATSLLPPFCIFRRLLLSSPHPVVLTLKAWEWCEDLTAV